jgi:serine/threonine protein phosphatase PrpC
MSNPDRPTEDRIFTTANAVIILDGASEPDPTDRNGGWYAETLGQEIQNLLVINPGRKLAEIVAEAIRNITDRHNLSPGGPSATVSIARWTDHLLDLFVLGDSPIVTLTRDGQIRELVDHRLEQVAQPERARLDEVDDDTAMREAWRALIAAERAARNVPGGYWIAETNPAAANEAVNASHSIGTISTILMMTDGLSDGVDHYRIPATYAEAAEIARRDPKVLVDLVHATEESDPDCVRWPRSKRHDDKSLAIIEIDNKSP